MQKKKIWIILFTVFAILIAVGITVFLIIRNDSGKKNTENNASQYDLIEEGEVVFLSVGQSVKIASNENGVFYTSSSPSVASVSEDGVVTALSVGEGKITAHREQTTAEYIVLVSKSVTKEHYEVPETNETALALAKNSVKAGEYTALSLHLENCAGLSAFSVGFTYDSTMLTLKAISGVNGVDSVQFTDDGKGNVKIIGISYLVNGIKAGDDGIVNLYFMAKSDAMVGNYDLVLSMNEGDMLVSVENGEEHTVDAKLYGASIEIKK